jgi:hypothetical protein
MRTRKPFVTKLANPEDGFVIPIALGFGLIMLLLATASVLRSQNDNISAINKRSTAKSLVAAETGVARIQDFLNRNRPAASVSRCVSTTAGACPDAVSVASWHNPSQIPNLCPSTDYTSTAPAFIHNNSVWTNVVAGDESQGQFRIVDYTAGSLTVEGRANSGTNGEAKSRLAATFPISTPSQNLVASLWVTGAISSSPKINSDVIIGSCSATSTATTVTFPTGKQGSLIKTPQAMPAAQTKPTTKIATVITAPTTNTSSYYELAKISDIPGNTLPRSTTTGYTSNDQPGSDGVYRYVVTSTTVTDPFDGSFKVTAGMKVRLWVKGNIDLSNKYIVNPCGSTGNCVFDVRIYPETSGVKTLTLNKGTAICDVFFHLPEYDLTFVNGIGTTAPLPEYKDCGITTKGTTAPATAGDPFQNTGVYWVKSWTGAVTGKNLLDPPRANWSKATDAATGLGFPTTPPPPSSLLSPQIGPVSAWDKQSF